MLEKRAAGLDLSELKFFPEGWTDPEFATDRPGREFNAAGFWLLVSCNPEFCKGWRASIFYGGDTEEAWTRNGFKNAAAARAACVTRALRMLQEARDAVQKADGR